VELLAYASPAQAASRKEQRVVDNSSPNEQIRRTFEYLNKRRVDRRGFLTGAGKLAGAGAIAFALTGAQFSSIFANHAGTDAPDLEDGNVGDPEYMGVPSTETSDCYDFDGDGQVTEFDVVQYALFLEHLENAFYRDGLEAFSAADFQRGLRVFREGSLEMSGTIFVNGSKVRDDVQRVADHERAHAEDLTALITSLGGTPVVECTSYNFDFSSVEAFMRTAQLLENTGVAAYVGAASCLSTPDFIRVAASIATVEARHASYFDLMTANKVYPSPYDLARPMGTTVDLVLATGIVGSCEQPANAPQPPFGRS
jgi:rubrerythrin